MINSSVKTFNSQPLNTLRYAHGLLSTDIGCFFAGVMAIVAVKLFY